MNDKKKKTHVVLVLDKSGSMELTQDAAVQGYNEQVQQLKLDAKDENQEILVSLVTFNGKIDEHLWNQPAHTLGEADPKDYVPKGATALRDAVGFVIQKLWDTTDTEDPDTAYLVIVISDGQNTENGPYTKTMLREMIASCQATGRWTFTYLGCGEQYLQELARETGVPLSNMAVWSNRSAHETQKGLHYNTQKSSEFFTARAQGATSSCTYQSPDLGKVANYTEEAASQSLPDMVAGAAAICSDSNRRAGGAASLNFGGTDPSLVTISARPIAELKSTIGGYSVGPKTGKANSVFGSCSNVKLG